MAVVKVTKRNGDTVSLAIDETVENLFNKLCGEIESVERDRESMVKMFAGTRALIFNINDVTDIEIF